LKGNDSGNQPEMLAEAALVYLLAHPHQVADGPLLIKVQSLFADEALHVSIDPDDVINPEYFLQGHRQILKFAVIRQTVQIDLGLLVDFWSVGGRLL
jgi:hypothetical protein